MNAGRKRGCGSCGESQSYESMLFDSVQPGDRVLGALDTIHTEAGGNIWPVWSDSKLSLDKVEEKETSLEKAMA